MDAAAPRISRSDEETLCYAFASRHMLEPTPKYRLPESGMPAAVAKQLIEDERQLDSNPRQNLASFVTTWMEPEARELIADAVNVNFIDIEQYPSSAEFEQRCVAMLADLFHAPPPAPGAKPTGAATIGSSEAIMLAGLAMKTRWQERRRAAGLPTDRPNLVMGHNAQVCWEKLCRYMEIEPRWVDLTEECFVMRPAEAAAACDENTIGVCAIMGSTYNGQFEDVEALAEAVAARNAAEGWDIRIHVDGASGGWIAAFLCPELRWDFRVPLVCSINVSGHKYGLVYPGLGWLVFRDASLLPQSLKFVTHYLGSEQENFTLNFSKGASTIVAQYFQFLRLGRAGYTRIFKNLRTIADHLADGLLATGAFRLLSDRVSLPLVAFAFVPYPDGTQRGYDEFALSDKLRERGWVLPAYTMAPKATHVKLLRAVIREDLSMSMCEQLIRDVQRAVAYLDHFHGLQRTASATASAAAAAAATEAYRQQHAPHRVHKHGHKRHAGVC